MRWTRTQKTSLRIQCLRPKPPASRPSSTRIQESQRFCHSFFMGIGQIYDGQIGKGILFILLYGISILLMFVVIGFVTTPILWIRGIVDANKSAKRINEELARQ